jgi:hypothetical protein
VRPVSLDAGACGKICLRFERRVAARPCSARLVASRVSGRGGLRQALFATSAVGREWFKGHGVDRSRLLRWASEGAAVYDSESSGRAPQSFAPEVDGACDQRRFRVEMLTTGGL